MNPQEKNFSLQKSITNNNEMVDLKIVEIENESYYKISNHNLIRPFLMNLVSDSNHWMFLSSNGGLTAGRKNPEFALFPYYTDDKLTEFADITGSKTIFQVLLNDKIQVWEPFSERFIGIHQITRNLYKNLWGNKVILEEINHDLGLKYSYQWNSSNLFGFVKKSKLENLSGLDYQITVLDGIQNIMPFGVNSSLQSSTSNLVDAYKRNELLAETGLGIFALSAMIVDKAEPGESLKANIAWSLGLDKPKYLVSSLQLNAFRGKQNVNPEQDVKGEKGAYFVLSSIFLPTKGEKNWKIIANVNQDQPQIVALTQAIKANPNLQKEIQEDIDLGTKNLIQLVAASDGLQFTADQLKDTRHFSNTLFNIMRGGIFDDNYQIEKGDFSTYLMNANKKVFEKNEDFIKNLNTVFNKEELNRRLLISGDPDLIRLCKEYLPLKFSRRHGDPSRPWNRFSINTRSEIDGSKILDYEGNWRDIFQNWEALVQSYPDFIEGMIFKFLNASTFDGYNPYRVTKGGFDWETIEPDNPWSYIGYWGDHQIIYLLKFLEFAQNQNPKTLENLFDKAHFVYANVPYRIKSYNEIVVDPKNTITFDEELDHSIRKKIETLGADGALLINKADHIHHVNFIEKILATVLAKTSNFVPEAGIWMNTQRPEWNDANNALVGNGVSVVTLNYLRRFLKFLENTLEKSSVHQVNISLELDQFFQKTLAALENNKGVLDEAVTNITRKKIVDALGKAGSDYRNNIYHNGFSGQKNVLHIADVIRFTKIALAYFEHTIDANKRHDNLYHAYNLISVSENGISIDYLSEMLEGQVAALSSGYLSTEEALNLLDALRDSALYREDQHSYMLYPNKELPKFLEKNVIPKASVEKSKLLMQLLESQNTQIINQDVLGAYHFNGKFSNEGDLREALEQLKFTEFNLLVAEEQALICSIFEEVFNHKAFTGRSGTFFSYEGLGSIYWHMVSKLHLAVQEVCTKAIEEKEDKLNIDRLLEHFHQIDLGIGVYKSPEVYGAFPTDPYSHTPYHRGAQQPGMTGQVKEDLLVRFAELGSFIEDGKLSFNPAMLRKSAFLKHKKTVHYINVSSDEVALNLNPNELAFTRFQVPVIYRIANKIGIEIHFTDHTQLSTPNLILDGAVCESLFHRAGKVKEIYVFIGESNLQA